MKKTIVSVAALGALCTAPLFAQDQPRATQPAVPNLSGQPDQLDQPRLDPAQDRAAQPGQARTLPAARPQAQAGDRVTAQKPEVQDTHAADFAQHVAACLILSNEAEIALTQPAIEKLQSDGARELAQMIVKDHTAFVAKLKPHAPQAANLKLNVHDAHKNATGAKTAENAAEANSTTDAAHGNATAADRSAAESMADKALRIEKSYVEHKVSMIQERLNKEQGQNFEQAFLGCQIAGHISMLAKLEALQPELQGTELAPLVEQAQQTTSAHLKQAEQLMSQEKDVEKGQGPNGAEARPARATQSSQDRPAATPER